MAFSAELKGRGRGKKWGRKMCVIPLWYRVHMLHIKRRVKKRKGDE